MSIYVLKKKKEAEEDRVRTSLWESWEKPAAELSLPTPCDSTHNQEFLTEDILITTTVLKQQKAAPLCEETKLFIPELFRQRLSSVENIVSNTKPT